MNFLKPLLLMLCLTSAAHAQTAPQNFDLACLNSPETASYQVTDLGDRVMVRAAHLYGPGAMPIFEGVISMNDLARIGKFAPLITAIGETQIFDFPKEQCQRRGEFVMQCQDFKGAPVVMMNGHRVRALSFYTTHIMLETIEVSYEQIQMNLFLEIDGESYFLPVRYNPHDCYSPKLLPGAK